MILGVTLQGFGCGGMAMDQHEHGMAISGRLSNAHGQGLPGVTVYASQTNGLFLRTAISDLQGRYSLKTPGEPMPVVLTAWPHGFLDTYGAQASSVLKVHRGPTVHSDVDFTFAPVEAGTISVILESPVASNPQPTVLLKQYFKVGGIETAFPIGSLNWGEADPGTARFRLAQGHYRLALPLAQVGWRKVSYDEPGTDVEVDKAVETQVALRETQP